MKIMRRKVLYQWLALLLAVVTVRYSHYFPAWGGTNCAVFRDGVCVSRMASGLPWQEWIGRAVACPQGWALGTVIEFENERWVCLDRVKTVEGLPYIDFLEQDARHAYGTLIDLEVVGKVDVEALRADSLLMMPELPEGYEFY